MVCEPSKDYEAAYVAGWFDADGCIYIKYRNGEEWRVPNVVLSGCSIDRDMLERVKDVLGGGAIRRTDRGPNRSPIYQWAAAGREDVERGLRLMYPFLSARRKAKADEALALLKAHPKSSKGKRP